MLILWMVRRWQYRRSLISLCMKFELVDNDRYAGSSSQLLENSSIHLQWLPNSSFILRHDSFFASYLASPSTVVHLRVERCLTWWMRSSNTGVFEHRARRVNREKWTHDLDVADVAYHLWLWHPFFKFHTFRVEVGSIALEFLSDNHCSPFFLAFQRASGVATFDVCSLWPGPNRWGWGGGGEKHIQWMEMDGVLERVGSQRKVSTFACDGWGNGEALSIRDMLDPFWGGSRAPEQYPFLTMWKWLDIDEFFSWCWPHFLDPEPWTLPLLTWDALAL